MDHRRRRFRSRDPSAFYIVFQSKQIFKGKQTLSCNCFTNSSLYLGCFRVRSITSFSVRNEITLNWHALSVICETKKYFIDSICGYSDRALCFTYGWLISIAMALTNGTRWTWLSFVSIKNILFRIENQVRLINHFTDSVLPLWWCSEPLTHSRITSMRIENNNSNLPRKWSQGFFGRKRIFASYVKNANANILKDQWRFILYEFFYVFFSGQDMVLSSFRLCFTCIV
jgi:hypothetical protein